MKQTQEEEKEVRMETRRSLGLSVSLSPAVPFVLLAQMVADLRFDRKRVM